MLDITILLTYKRSTLSPSKGCIHNSQRINIESMSCGDLSKFFEFIQSCVQTVQLNLEVISNLSLFLEFFNNCFLSLCILCLKILLKKSSNTIPCFKNTTIKLGREPNINQLLRKDMIQVSIGPP